MPNVLAILLLSVGVVSVAQSGQAASHLHSSQADVLAKWLGKHPGYRLATEADCNCDEDLIRMRTHSDGAWKAIPNYQPYYVEGDFNWDGAKDFAVGVVKGRNPSYFQVLVFDGPFSSTHPGRAAFLSDPLPLGQALFFGDPRPHPQMLVVGSFESEGAALRPTKKGYVWEYPDE
jgi:hypothetical protein